MLKFNNKNIKIIPLLYIAFVFCTTGLPLYSSGCIFMGSDKIQRQKICGIYKITSPTGRIYIGQSCDILYYWNARYKRKTLFCKSQPKLYNSLLKHGWQAHKFDVVEPCIEEQLNEKEVYYID